MPAKKKPFVPDPFSQHVDFYEQERKWFWEAWPAPRLFALLGNPRPASPESCDAPFISALLKRLPGHVAKNHMGLYRNDSLTLACSSITRHRHAEGLDALLVVAFIDIQGAENTAPGHKSFSRDFSETVEIVVTGILALETVLGQDRCAT